MFQVLQKSLIELDINGEKKTVTARPADTLLNAIRNELNLLGAKASCENGDCGSCTVLIDGLPIKACMMLAAEAVGHRITTIEGIKSTPIQSAFLEKFAYQCGYCTPGFILNCHALISTHPDADDAMIKEWLESNLCRCTGYEEIKSAVKSVLDEREK
jgi:aerobic carbon-monoxide dehydrogenase small subunit